MKHYTKCHTNQPITQHAGTPLVLDGSARRPLITREQRDAVSLLEVILWGDAAGPLVDTEATRGGNMLMRRLRRAAQAIKTASLHRMLVLLCQRTRAELSHVTLRVEQQGHPGPWAASRHLDGTDCAEVSIRRLLITPHHMASAHGGAPRVHLLRQPMMAYYSTDVRACHMLEADLSGVDVALEYMEPRVGGGGGHGDGGVVNSSTAPQQGPFVQYTEHLARRKRTRVATVPSAVPHAAPSAAPSTPPPPPPATRCVLVRQWAATASMTVAPRGAAVDTPGGSGWYTAMGGYAAPSGAHGGDGPLPSGLHGVAEESSSGMFWCAYCSPQRTPPSMKIEHTHKTLSIPTAPAPTNTAQVNIHIQLSLSAIVPTTTPAATATIARIVERLVIYDTYADYWTRRPLVSVHDNRRLWWKYAGSAVREAAYHVARRNVPLQALAARHRLRVRHAALYNTVHARNRREYVGERPWGDVGGDVVRRLHALESRMTLEEVCTFRLMSALKHSAFLQGSVPRQSAGVQVCL